MVRIGGECQTPEPGTYCGKSRTWKAGDTADLEFPLELRYTRLLRRPLKWNDGEDRQFPG